ncbi:Glycoside hydrolase superfamily [Phytophthora cactorum]|nr:Glycoside hydrolase superfamily [Phytophthora cactorum]
MQDVGSSHYAFPFPVACNDLGSGNPPHASEPEGIAFYHALIDAMNVRGIVPILTIYHWDLPSALMHELTPKGWLSPEIVDHYVEYATIIFQEYGHKVDYWTTFNEPLAFVGYSYGTGMFAPGHKAHLLKPTRSRGMFSLPMRRLSRNSASLKRAALSATRLASELCYVLSTLTLAGSSNRSLPATTLPSCASVLATASPVTEEESALLKGSYDILMMNHYYSKVVTDCGSESSVTPCSSLTAGWEADKGVDEDHMMPGTMQPRPDKFGNNYCGRYTGYPPGYLDMIRYLHSHDPTVDILLTENGWCGMRKWKIGTNSVTTRPSWGRYTRPSWRRKSPSSETGSPDFEKPKSTDLKRIPRPAAKWFHKVATTKCLDGWDQLEIAADSSVARSAEHLGFSVAFIVFVAVALTAAVVTFKRRLGYQRLRQASSSKLDQRDGETWVLNTYGLPTHPRFKLWVFHGLSF